MHTSFVVMKFGGTSVASVERWHTIARMIRQRLSDGEHPVIVCSAISGVSNLLDGLGGAALENRHGPLLKQLFERHAELATALGIDAEWLLEAIEPLHRLCDGISLLGEVTPRTKARIMSAGELLLTRLGITFLTHEGFDAQRLDIRDFLVSEDTRGTESWLGAQCLANQDKALQIACANAKVTITQGFIARSREGDTVLLGRGGSDTSAAIIAARLGAERCEIWTDVPGVYTANPRETPEARLITRLDYDEAQEIASAGAAVLHPRCIEPLKNNEIPLLIRCTPAPEAPNTLIDSRAPQTPSVKVISAKRGIGLLSMSTLGMWQQSGFLADVFGCFKAHGFSVDLVSTSETNVTASIEPSKLFKSEEDIQRLCAALSEYCDVQYISDCVAISLVGRHIRATIHKLGPALEVFESEKILLISQAASDLNLTFVVEAAQAERLVQKLHVLLFGDHASAPHLGPKWRETFQPNEKPKQERWWETRRELLLNSDIKTPAYVYDLAMVQTRAQSLLNLTQIDRVLYAMKANDHPQILRILEKMGLGFEAVSLGEIKHLFNSCPTLDPTRVFFTPNFAPREEYVEALDYGVTVNIDNLFALQHWGETFRGRQVALRIDPGQGRGHHQHVHTGGKRSKFGIDHRELPLAIKLAQKHQIEIVGLHAHAGSGISDPDAWRPTAQLLYRLSDSLPSLRFIDIGGGLGVVEKPGDQPLDLDGFDDSLRDVKQACPHLELWIEPGRFLVAEAGVVLTTVTQLKEKTGKAFVGVDAGMHTLIRPSLYGAWHEIQNLSANGKEQHKLVNIVGPICESGDTLGYDRTLPEPVSGDLLVIGTAGAYGRVMSSEYNRRRPADEWFVALDGQSVTKSEGRES